MNLKPCYFFGWVIIVFFILILVAGCSQKSEEKSGLAKYKDSSVPIDQRVEDLLSQMTIEEKIGQMTQLCFSTITLNGSKDLIPDGKKFEEFIVTNNVGSFLSGSGNAQQWAKFITEVQDIAVKKTRLGIPLIIGIDHVHGANYVDTGTIFPHNLNLACTFDTALANLCAYYTAAETAPLALSWNFAPVCDVGLNPFWPRHYETFGEDPYMCGEFAAGFIKAYQSFPSLSACAKHFIGYSDPKSGWDRTPSEISDQRLYEFFVPSFEKAFAANVKTLMVNSGEVNGEPIHGSKKYLNDLLRKRLGFNGVILTDIKDIIKIIELHSAAGDEKEATLRAIEAGVDMSMACNSVEFLRIMKELVDEGKLPTQRIDESVRRILKLKFELGLFENPYPDTTKLHLVGSEKHHQTAIESAKASLVLLKNENTVLPVKTEDAILLAGLGANDIRILTGPWTYGWLGAPNEKHAKKAKSVFEALSKEIQGEVVFADTAETNMGFKTFKAKLPKANVVIIVAGDEPYSEFKGNFGDINLPENQKRLVIEAKKANKKTVLIVVGGRPKVFADIEKYCDAVIFAGLPGQGGGIALAQLLTGKFNPSGKLAFSYPAQQAHFAPYHHKPSEAYFIDKSISEGRQVYQYPFGYGISFSPVEYSDLKVLPDTLLGASTDTLHFEVTITNKGTMPVAETALWFVTDQVGFITRPVKLLKKFEKIGLNPNESKKVRFDFVPKIHGSYPDASGNVITEPGKFVVSVGELKKSVHLKN